MEADIRALALVSGGDAKVKVSGGATAPSKQARSKVTGGATTPSKQAKSKATGGATTPSRGRVTRGKKRLAQRHVSKPGRATKKSKEVL